MKKRKPINWFKFGFILLFPVLVGSLLWIYGMMNSLINYRSPLASTPPLPGEKIGSPITRKVIIVLMDALRVDTSTDSSVMPFLNHLRSLGSFATMTSRPPTSSSPAYGTMLTGAWPDLNDTQVLNPQGGESARPYTQDDIFAAAHRAGLKTAVSSYIWFNQVLLNDHVDEVYSTNIENHEVDHQEVDAALPWVEQGYQLVMIHLDQIDYAGHHEGGPRSPNWNAAANRVDFLLQEIVTHMNLEKDTIIVLSDHGQIDAGGHGGTEKVVRTEPFVIAGAGILKGVTSEIQMADVAPTLAVLLGTSIPASNQGRPLLEFLDLPENEYAVIQDRVNVQQELLLSTYTQAIDWKSQISSTGIDTASPEREMELARLGRLGNERVWRNVLAVFLAILPGYLIFMNRNNKILWPVLGAVVYLGTFNLYFLLLEQKSYSISWINGEASFLGTMATAVGIAVIIGWIMVMWGQKGFHLKPRLVAYRTLGFIWMVIYLVSIPILLNFAINGITITWTLPVFPIFTLGFLSLAQLLFIIPVGLLLMGIGSLISLVSSSPTIRKR